MTDRFFRIMTNLAVTHSLSNEAAALRSAQLSYLALDAYVHLVVLLVNGTYPAWKTRRRSGGSSRSAPAAPLYCKRRLLTHCDTL